MQPLFALETTKTEEPSLPLSSSNLFSRLLRDEIGIENPDYELTWNDIFGPSEKNYGQNLYLQIYQNVSVKPEKQAIQHAAQAAGLTLNEVNSVLSGSIDPILKGPKARPAMTQEEAFRQMVRIQERFNEERVFVALQSELEAELVPTEIFANGDLSDSGFDLIVDLNKIEEILFTQKGLLQSTVNQKYITGGQPTTPTPGPKPITPGPTTEGAIYGGATGGFEEKKGAVGEAPGAPAGAKKEGVPEGKEVEVAKPLPLPEDNPSVCLSDPTLTDALQEFEKEKAALEAQLPKGEKEKVPPEKAAKKAEEGAKTTPGIFAEGKIPEGGPFFAGEVVETELPEAAPAGNWLKDKLCPEGKFYCVEIKFITKKVSSYVKTDDCIRCHVEKINEAFKKMLQHSLLPHKVTGNIYESAVCKKGWSISALLNMNLILIPLPIVNPPNDDIIFGKSIANEWRVFWQRYSPFNYESKKDNKKSGPGKESGREPVTGEQALMDEAVQLVLSQASPETTQADVVSEINRIINAERIKVARAIEDFDTEVLVGGQAMTYQSLAYELDQMNAYFEGIKQLFEGIRDKSCKILTNKPYVQ